MTTPVRRDLVQAFLQAFATRDTAKLAPLLADDVHWQVVGPVQLLRFCGERHGKAAVIDAIDRISPQAFRVSRLEPDMLLIDGDCFAMLGRISGTAPDGRTISYRCTLFVRFRNGKVIEYRSLFDSFDAAEQVLGFQIPIAPDRIAAEFDAGNLVAV